MNNIATRLLSIAGLAVLILTGCGGGGGGSSSGAAPTVPRFAYSANFNDGTVSMYTVDPATGQLRHNGYVTAGTNPHSVAVHPSGKFVYVSNNGDGDRVSSYGVGPDGRLTAIGAATFGSGLMARGITVDPAGKFLYLTLAGAGAVSAYAIAADGTLTFLADDFSVAQPFSVAVDPTGKFAYVASFGGNAIFAFSIGTNGTLAPIDADAATAGSQPSIAAGTNPHFVTFDPTGRFLYAANFGSGDVSAYRTSASGSLTKVPGSPFTAGAGARGIGIDPTGKFAYVANHFDASISAYTIDGNTGALTQIDADAATNGVQNFPAGNRPGGITLDPSGKFLYAANLVSNDVSAYAIDAATGALTALPGNFGRSGNLDVAMTHGTAPVTYTPKFAYVANQSPNNIAAYAINAGTGALAAIGSPVAAGTGPVSVAVDPSGRFAYAANRTSSDVSAYSIGASGALSAIDADAATAGIQATIPAGTVPLYAAVDPSGRFLYVANVGSGVADPGTVSAYTINPTTGALTRIDADPTTLGIQDFAAGGGPDAVVVDPTGRFLYVANYGFPGSGSVSAYEIDAVTGGLTAISGSPFASGGNGSDSIAVDSSGRFVYVTNLLSDSVTAFAIDAVSGGLTRIDADFVTPGTQDLAVTNARPVSMTADPAGGFVYIATACGSIWAFNVDATSGALTRVDSAPGGACFAFRDAPNSIVVDSSGRFVYNSDYTNGDSASGYKIDAATGALTPVSGSPFAAGPSAKSVVTSGAIE